MISARSQGIHAKIHVKCIRPRLTTDFAMARFRLRSLDRTPTARRRAIGLRTALLSLAIGVGPAPAIAASPPIADPNAATNATHASQIATRPPLPTRADINAEGEIVSIPLDPYRPSGVPIEMAVPTGRFAPAIDTDARDTEIRLTASYTGEITNEEVYIAIVWPQEAIGIGSAFDRLLSEGGWLDERGIEPMDSTATPRDPDRERYDWERQRWHFESGFGTLEFTVGEVILGELDGRAFWIVKQMPIEFVEGYGGLMDIVTDTLRDRDL